MESTSIYWILIWDILEKIGFELTLVNPYFIKQLPGKKSNAKDAKQIANYLYKELLGGSMIPNALIKELRIFTRKYRKFKEKQSQVLTEMDRIMVTASIRIGIYMSNLHSKSVINIIEALISGERNPDNLVKLVYGNSKNKQSGKLKEALTGNVKTHHRMSLKWSKEQYDLLENQIAECMLCIEEICNEHFGKEIELLQTIPGVAKTAALCILVETGADMKEFENSGKISGWAGLRPRNNEIAGKFKSKAIIKGNKYLRAILVQCAWAASRTKGSYFKEKFRSLALRKSPKKALIAIAGKMLVVAWNILKDKGTILRKWLFMTP